MHPCHYPKRGNRQRQRQRQSARLQRQYNFKGVTGAFLTIIVLVITLYLVLQGFSAAIDHIIDLF